MYELEKKTMEIFRDMNKEWVNIVRESIKNEAEIDLTIILDKVNDKYTDLNQKFEECKIRLDTVKNKRWWK